MIRSSQSSGYEEFCLLGDNAETSVDFQRTTVHYIFEDRNSHDFLHQHLILKVPI
jgi:hypothetical protein